MMKKTLKLPNIFKRENDPHKKKPKEAAVCHSSNYNLREVKILSVLDSLCAYVLTPSSRSSLT